MKRIAAILSSALLAAACSDKPPESPASVTTTGTTMTTAQSPTAANVAPTPTAHDSTMTGSSTTMSPAYAESQTADGSSSNGTASTAASKPSTWGGSAASGTATTTAQPGVTPAPAPVAATTPAAAPTPKADNTKQNVRDRHDTLTPTDQGNSKEETQITASIRKQIVGSKVSFNAKNAKVITQGTKVTLRGPVKTDEEKAQLESFARGTAGVTDVDNQLEVKK